MICRSVSNYPQGHTLYFIDSNDKERVSVGVPKEFGLLALFVLCEFNDGFADPADDFSDPMGSCLSRFLKDDLFKNNEDEARGVAGFLLAAVQKARQYEAAMREGGLPPL